MITKTASLNNVELIIKGYSIQTVDDVECILHIDSDGDLHEIEFLGSAEFGTKHQPILIDRLTKGPLPDALWTAGLEWMQQNKHEVDEALAREGYVNTPERPDYTGREYHPLTF